MEAMGRGSVRYLQELKRNISFQGAWYGLSLSKKGQEAWSLCFLYLKGIRSWKYINTLFYILVCTVVPPCGHGRGEWGMKWVSSIPSLGDSGGNRKGSSGWHASAGVSCEQEGGEHVQSRRWMLALALEQAVLFVTRSRNVHQVKWATEEKQVKGGVCSSVDPTWEAGLGGRGHGGQAGALWLCRAFPGAGERDSSI